jgi:uncharacterized protein YqgQ
MKKLLLVTLIFAIHFSAYAAESFSTLEERMSGKEFMQTGLDKLSDAELFELNEWLRRHSVATLENSSARPEATTGGSAVAVSQTGAVPDKRGFENTAQMKDDDKYDNTIHANIAGTFTGWEGSDTEFKLTNGMVWRQVEGDSFNVKATQNAEITIKKGIMGGWRLSMVGYNSTVRVKRIK